MIMAKLNEDSIKKYFPIILYNVYYYIDLLAFELIADGSIRTNWLKNTHDHVIPMAYLLDERFGSYFSGVFDYIEKRGCIESKRLEFDELQKTRAIN